MTRADDLASWQGRLDELARRHQVPGASVAVLVDGEVTALATGVLHTGTGVAATTDSLFQIGSISKVYTATLLLRLIDQGLAGIDTPVAEILPGFRVADPDVGRLVTLRHLLAHTSGVSGDFLHDTGRGDDCLARYVDACADLPQTHPLGATFSYCNSGFIILGRIVERLTGMTWDAALAEYLTGPIGLAHTWTLPEDVLRFRTAMGHVSETFGDPRQPAQVWGLPRSDGPAGAVCASASDVIAFARLHLDGGIARDGTRVLAANTVAEMRRPQVELPNPYRLASHWGLGWALTEWDGRQVYGHDGDTIGQSAFLRVVPDEGVAIALLANGDLAGELHQDVVTELLTGLCGMSPPPPPEPPTQPGHFDMARYLGRYERLGTRMEVTFGDDQLRMRLLPTDGLDELLPTFEMDLIPVAANQVLGRPPYLTIHRSLIFYTLPDGRTYVHDGSRATPKVA